MSAQKINVPDLKKVDAKLKVGILILLVIGVGFLYYMQPHTFQTTGPSIGSTGQSNTSGTGAATQIVVQTAAQAANELTIASSGAASSSSTVDEALAILPQ